MLINLFIAFLKPDLEFGNFWSSRLIKDEKLVEVVRKEPVK